MIKNHPLTGAQYNIWVDQQINIKSPLYNISGMINVKGCINHSYLELAINMLLEDNDVFRLSFHVDEDGTPFQKFCDLDRYSLSLFDFSNTTKPYDEALNWVKSDLNKSYSLDDSRLYYFCLIKLSAEHYIYYCKCHHIIVDGWGMSLISKEIRSNYNDIANSIPLEINKLNSYVEFIEDDISYINSKRYKEAETFWKERLNKYPESILNSKVFSSSKGSVYSSRRESLIISFDEFSKLKDIASDNNVTISALMLAILSIHISKITGVKIFTLGIPLLNRPGKCLKRTIGLFVETTPILIDLIDGCTFSDLLVQISNELSSCYRHQRFPLNKIENLAGMGSLSRLFDVVVSYENHIYDGKFLDYETKGFSLPPGEQSNALTIHIEESSEDTDVIIHFDFREDLFAHVPMEGFKSQFQYLYREIMMFSNKSLNEYNIISDFEKKSLVTNSGDIVEYPWNMNIIDLFEKQVSKTPDNVAIIYNDSQLTYNDLNLKANSFQWKLKKKYGIGVGDVVIISLDRSDSLIIALLAVIKSGATYLPLDPSYPEERVEYIIKDSNSKLIISNKNINEFLGPGGSNDNPIRINDSQSILYTIYTSGSTGLPKGVKVSNQNYINYISWAKDYYLDVSCKGNFPLFTSISFDLTTTSVFLTLLSGNTLVVFPQKNDISTVLADIFNGKHVDSIKLTPSHISLLSGLDIKNSSIDLAIVGGEELLNSQIEILRGLNPNMRIVNEYGPTETTVGSIVKNIKDSKEKVVIGRGISNTDIYILDEYLSPAPVGVPGEIYIGGKGVTPGYLGKPELTKEKFLDDPFNPAGKMYKTGDLGRWLKSGDIEFLGRLDGQVKVKGNRVELGEIENVLLEIPSITSALVILDNENKSDIVAYYTSKESLDTYSIRSFLIKKLPLYMVPNYFIKLDKVPLTPNGKVDKNSVPGIDRNNIDLSSYVPPCNSVESMLADIWKEVLGCREVSVKSNFFELGGDSIKAIQIVSRLKQKNYKGDVSDLFSLQTIREFSKSLSVVESLCDQSMVEGVVPLTPIQHWFFKEVDTPKHYYNQSLLLNLKDDIDSEKEDALKSSITEIVRHHDALRMNYELNNSSIVQTNKGYRDIYFKKLVIRNSVDPDAEFRLFRKEVECSFNLESDILLRFVLVDINGSWKLLIVAHHLVIDGVSWRILLRDLETGYKHSLNNEDIKLPPKSSSFLSWSMKLKEYGRSRQLKRESTYWNILERERSPLIEFHNQAGDRIEAYFTVDKLNTEKLLKCSGSSINTLFITALSRMISSFFNKKSIYLDLESHGRSESFGLDITRSVGWFTAIYPVSIDLEGCFNIEEDMTRVKESLEDTPNHGIGYGILKYEDGDSYKRYPCSEVLFNYLGQLDNDLDGEFFTFDPESSGASVSSELNSPYKLTFNGMVQNGELKVIVDSSVFTLSELNNILTVFKNELLNVVNFITTGSDLSKSFNDDIPKNKNKMKRIKI